MTIRRLPDPPYSVAEAAHVLGVSTDTVRLMIHDGRLKGAFRAGAKLWRVPVESIDAYIQRQSLSA
jgi:excisionase family DNA binding protein